MPSIRPVRNTPDLQSRGISSVSCPKCNGECVDSERPDRKCTRCLGKGMVPVNMRPDICGGPGRYCCRGCLYDRACEYQETAVYYDGRAGRRKV
jgi:hypothetical protein